MSFKKDLEKGKLMEEIVKNKMNNNGFSVYNNPNEKGIDLLETVGIEVKFDEYSLKSGNFYIEFECADKPSGILSDYDFPIRRWAHSDGNNIFVLDGCLFREYIKIMIDKCRKNKSLTSKGIRLVEAGGDGGKSKGLLIPVDKIREMAEFIYII